MTKNKKKILLIGWDAADWKVINPLLDSGKMPALESIVNNGTIGNISTLDPPLSPMLWTSIATGKKADKHGILGFIEPEPEKGGIRPVNNTSRKSRAIWNILQSQGYKSNVVGWWPSHPAEPINGVMVSNFFQQASQPVNKPWPMVKGTIHPETMVKELRSLRVHPEELTHAHVLPFIPNAKDIDQEKDKRLEALLKVTAHAASVQAVSTYLMENTEWDFMAVYFDEIDHYSHAFMKFHPPKIKGVPDEMFKMYKDVVSGGYIFHDMMLERMLKLAGDETTIILVSDHGFHSDHLRPTSLPKLPAAPALEHSPYGIFCIKGDNIKKDERVYGATLLDVTPTILHHCGLPIGKDMDGKVLYNVFEEPEKTQVIDSWEKIEGDFGTHPEEMKENTFEAAEAMQQLVELGYVEDPGEDKQKAMETAKNEADYNLSRVYASRNDFGKSIEILKKLYDKNKKDIRYNLDLTQYYLKTRQIDKASEVIENLKTLEEKTKPNINYLEGILLMQQQKPYKALEKLKLAEESNIKQTGLYLELGKVYLQIRRYKDAERAYSKALEIDGDNAAAYHGLGVSYLRQKKYEGAADMLLSAIGLLYHFPPAHFHLAESLFHLEKYKESSEAFELCLMMAPNILKARWWLVKIYGTYLINAERENFHQKIINEVMKGQIIIVSGLPRSGTSMMMQMLEAGGFPVFTDEKRKADNSNPKGYYEVEEIKKLATDKSILEKAEGKAVKVITHLLKFLPANFKYKVIYMQRDLTETIISQQKMLGKNIETAPMALVNNFNKEAERIDIWQKKNLMLTWFILIISQFSQILRM